MKVFSYSILLFIGVIGLSYPGSIFAADGYGLKRADMPESTIPQFRQVETGIYRGGRPEASGLRELQSIRVKTIINLEDDPTSIRQEAAQAKSLGMNSFSSPMSAGVRPTDGQVNQILRALQTTTLFPIFIHCKHGQDRTGLIIGLYRVLIEKWTPENAYREMLSIGFHPQFQALDRYFRDRTGYTGHGYEITSQSETSNNRTPGSLAIRSVIPRFLQVTNGIYRGGRPGPGGLTELSQGHFKAIIDLEDDQGAIKQESDQAHSLGIAFYTSPMSGGTRPTDDQINRILSALQAPSSLPIFVHCYGGVDRTGLVIGLYRVLVQKWNPADAYKEMLALGFHPYYKPLDQYFRDRAGYYGP